MNIRPVVFDWSNHSHVLTKQEVVRQSGYRDAQDDMVCFICTEGARQHRLTGGDHLAEHPETCVCLWCRVDPDEPARQRAKAKDVPIPF